MEKKIVPVIDPCSPCYTVYIFPGIFCCLLAAATFARIIFSFFLNFSSELLLLFDFVLTPSLHSIVEKVFADFLYEFQPAEGESRMIICLFVSITLTRVLGVSRLVCDVVLMTDYEFVFSLIRSFSRLFVVCSI